ELGAATARNRRRPPCDRGSDPAIWLGGRGQPALSLVV
ncbi:MAG: hypothetical protein AVDCRST_MAG39-2017, partial [uncultured Sphingomonadaceae bacterium]